MAMPPVPEGELQEALAALPQADWQQLAGQRLLIAGGTGFLGCWLLEVLLHANRRLDLGMALNVLSRRPQAFADKAPHLAGDPAVTLLRADVRDGARLDLRGDLMIHAAADVESPAQDPVAAFTAIVEATRGALALAQRAGARRFLHVSSGAVYGPQPPTLERVAEDHAAAPDGGDPRAAYAIGKRVSEWLADQAGRQHAFPVVHARVFALVGPYLPLDAHFAAGNFLQDAAAGAPVRVAGNGSPVRSYLYGADAAAWLVRLLLRGEAGQAYNVGSEEAVSILELARRIAGLAGADVQVADPHTPAGAPPRYVPDTARARAALGLVQYTDLSTALERSLQWARRLRAATASHPAAPVQDS